MASYRVHALGGLGAFACFTGLLWCVFQKPISWSQAGLYFSITLMAALFPDVDTDSKAQRSFYLVLLLLDIYLVLKRHYAYAALLGLAAMFPAVGRHRGWTHTRWAMILAPLPIVVLPHVIFKTPLSESWPWYAAAVLGYFSHLLLDRKF